MLGAWLADQRICVFSLESADVETWVGHVFYVLLWMLKLPGVGFAVDIGQGHICKLYFTGEESDRCYSGRITDT